MGKYFAQNTLKIARADIFATGLVFFNWPSNLS
jgi:hypothetical protein